jgi:hypothetical protein
VTPPSWVGGIRGSTARVRPGPALPLVAFTAAALATVVVAGYGAARIDAPWSVLAGLAGLGGLALALRGFPLVAVPALLVAVVCWGFVSRSLVPDSFGDLGAVAELIAANLAFAVPLGAGLVAAIWADGRRCAQAGVAARYGDQRWFGVNRGEPEPQLPGLEQIPSARFFALPSGASSHLVAAGRRVALVGTTVWPRGEYGVEANEIVRNGRTYTPGTDEVDGAVDDLRAWAAKLAPAGAICRGYLVVHPASERLTDTVRIDIPLLEGVQVVAAGEFLELAGGFLTAEPYTVDVDVMAALAHLHEPPPESARVPEPDQEPAEGGTRR